MKIITSTETNRLRIENSIRRILDNCSSELKTDIENLPLIITDDFKATEIYDDHLNLFRRAFSDGFGCIKGNVIYEESRFHLVVLNITNIDIYRLTDSEFDGVFSHELGHVFNENPRREVPSILKGNTMAEINIAKRIASKEVETYADYFSKQTGTSNGLLRSMKKYMASENCINRELFVERIKMLNTDTILLGVIKEVR